MRLIAQAGMQLGGHIQKQQRLDCVYKADLLFLMEQSRVMALLLVGLSRYASAYL